MRVRLINPNLGKILSALIRNLSAFQKFNLSATYRHIEIVIEGAASLQGFKESLPGPTASSSDIQSISIQ